MSMSQKASTEVASPGSLREKPMMASGSAGARAVAELVFTKLSGEGQGEAHGEVSGVVLETDGISKICAMFARERKN